MKYSARAKAVNAQTTISNMLLELQVIVRTTTLDIRNTRTHAHGTRTQRMSLAEQTRRDGAGTKHDASIKHERSFSSCRPLTGGPHRAPGQLGPTTRPERLFTYPLSLRRFSRRLHLIAKFIIPKQVIIRRNIVRRLANFRTTFSLQVVIS